MELQIYKPTTDGFIKSIECNHEELKKEVAEKLDKYNNMVYSPENIKEAKEDRANLNKFKQVLETERKKIKKQILEPYNDFEAKIKDITSIIDEPINAIDKMIKEVDQKDREAKRITLENYYLGYAGDLIKDIGFESILDDKWLNKSFTLKKAKEKIVNKIQEIRENIETLNNLTSYSFEAKTKYIETLNIVTALNYANELADLERKKIEEFEIKEAEAESKVTQTNLKQEEKKEQTISNINQEAYQPKRTWISFKALLSVDEAKRLNKFFRENNIKFDPIKGE